ncbi:MAG: serine protease [Armatimonadetes bacterium]|nr:serine protease [Armatimonadota bacterium]
MTLSQGGVIVGQGVLISSTGLAIAPGEAAFGYDGAPRRSLSASQSNKREMAVKVESYDAVTDLALIRVPGLAGGDVKFAQLASRFDSSVVMVTLHSGPARAQMARRGLTGVVGLGKRYMPLNEIRLEAGATALTGSPVFSADGKLVGILMALLNDEIDTRDMPGAEVAPKAFGGGARPTKSFGPMPSATAFSLDLPVLDRVIEGFLSEKQQVTHPWIGLFFKTSPSGGAEVTRVVGGSPAEAAGIKVGDVITAAGRQPFDSHVDFAAYLFDQRVGASCDLQVRRGTSERKVRVKIAKDTGSGHRLRRVTED